MEQTLTKRKGLSLKARKNLVGYGFITPALIFFVIFTLLPLGISIYISLFRTDKFFNDMTYIGLDNFKGVLTDKLFRKSLVNILLYALMAVSMNIVLSLCLALLLNSKKFMTKFFRVVFYMPAVTSAVAAALVWLWLMNPVNGLLNTIIEVFGLKGYTWLSNSKSALFSVTLVTVWQGLGGNMIIFLAALQGLPDEVYEAAHIDGATRLRCFFTLTIPFIAPTMFFILTMTLIGSFQLYDQVYILTSGGPGNATMTPVYLIWQNAFGNAVQQAGKAAAQSIALFLIIMVVTFVVRFGMRFVNSEV